MQGARVLVSRNANQPWLRRLTLPAYQVKDAARYADVSTTTVLNWQRESVRAGSAIASRAPREPLSYLKLQELAIVAAMRDQGIKLEKIRLARDYLRQFLGVEFPFSDRRVLTDGQDILMRLESELGKSARLMVANRGGQYVWPEVIDERFAEFDYEGDIAVRWRVGGNETKVVIDPRLAFGAPTVRGVPTWALRGRFIAGEALEDIASDFLIDPDDVRKALVFEGITLH